MAKTVLDAVREANRIFRSIDADPIEAIIVSRNTGIRLMADVREQDHIILPPAERLQRVVEHPDGSVWQEANCIGVKVRWPANKLATKNGYEWI